MTKRFKILSVSLLLSLLCVGAFQCEQASAASPSWEHYKVLTENNIFLRDRARARPRERSVAPVVPVRVPERDFVLTGIVQRDTGCIAFIEDMRNGETLRVRSGDAIADGQIVDITVEGLVYRKDDQTRNIQTGNALGGASSLAAPTAGSTSVDGSIAPATRAASPGESAILERLRQRREKELKTQ